MRPWEQDLGKPDRIASALDIMLEGPIGAASFNNEFGRPNILGYFRSFEQRVESAGRSTLRGYHKPIMIAGGIGNIRRMHVEKATIVPGSKIVVLGGPAMLIGLGGGAASSVGAGASAADLDFASVQRGNPEMQRRAQEVIDACWTLGEENPILLIHDVGAGGLSNAVPESVAQGSCGGRVDLRKVPSDEPGMSPLEIWCNEAQERYVLIVAAAQLAAFGALCERERCLFAVIGEVTDDGLLHVDDPLFGNTPVQMPLATLLGKPPRMTRDVRRLPHAGDDFDPSSVELREAAMRLLRLPTIADKTFLVTIGDRSVGGMISRDPMVGPWQVPVSDVAVTTSDYFSNRGEAMAMGERTPLALHRRRGLGSHGRRRGGHQHRRRRRRAHRGHPTLGQLDGGLRRARRGRGPLRHGARHRRGTVPGARHRHPGGQGLAVHEDGVAGARARTARWSRPCR